MLLNRPPNGAEAMLRMLEAHGVEHVFGLCGDTSLPLYDALAGSSIDHLLMRDERHAAYAADAYARLTGRVGVCEGPSGGGATHILPGVVEASESSVPVLAVTTDIATSSTGRYALTELDQEALFRPLARFTRTVRSSESLPRIVRAAFRAMTSQRPAAAHLGLPFDVQRASVPEEEIWADARFGRFPALRAGCDPDDAEELLDALLAARRPLAVAGGGVTLAGAEDELAIFAQRLDLPVATSVSGQGAIAEVHPCAVGVVGSNGGTPATREAVGAADLVLFLGCRAGSVTTERWRHPPPDTPILHIDSDPAVLGANYRTRAALCADLRLALRHLNSLLDDIDDPPGFGGRETAARAWSSKRSRFERDATGDSPPVPPAAVVAALSEILPDDSLLVADPGTPCPFFSAHYRLRRAGRTLLTNRAHGALGWAIGASVGAQTARPGARVAAITGDGSFGFAVGELETLQRLSLPVAIVVLANASFGWIKAGQKHGFGKRYFGVDFSATDHASVARAYGLRSWTVRETGELLPALEAALAVDDAPTLVEVQVQPLEDSAAPVSEWVA